MSVIMAVNDFCVRRESKDVRAAKVLVLHVSGAVLFPTREPGYE